MPNPQYTVTVSGVEFVAEPIRVESYGTQTRWHIRLLTNPHCKIVAACYTSSQLPPAEQASLAVKSLLSKADLYYKFRNVHASYQKHAMMALNAGISRAELSVLSMSAYTPPSALLLQ